jgi:hypothetical protein
MARELIAFDVAKMDTHAKESAGLDYERLDAFLNSLAQGLDQRLKEETRTGMEAVIAAFRDVAQQYYERAEELIQSDSEITPLERSEKYQRVLEHLREHALLLAELTRPLTQKTLPAARRDLLTNAIRFIAQRLESGGGEAWLEPVLMSSFRHVHFRYAPQFGLIGIPPDTAAEEDLPVEERRIRHLSVLWHEVAAHAIAVAKYENAAQLDIWASDLRTALQQQAGSWETYRESYRESVLHNLPKRKELEELGILADYENLYKQNIVTDQIIDADPGWQKMWLIEFLEDLFWIMVFEDEQDVDVKADAVLAMANALAQRYPNPSIGDPQHPPLHLRLLVGMAYLSPDDPQRMAQMIQFLSPGGDDPFHLNDAASRDLAVEIADFCRQQVIKVSNPILFGTVISPDEKRLASLVLDPDTNPSMLQGIVKIDGSTPPLPQIPTRLLSEIAGAKNIDELLDIEFTFTDPFGPPSGVEVIPPPPPYN